MKDDGMRLHPYWRRLSGACPETVRMVVALLLIVFGSVFAHTVWSMASETSSVALDVDPSFEILFEALKDARAGWNNNVWSTGGFLVLALGWLLTAKHARILLRRRAGVRRVAMAAVFLISLVNCGLNIEIAFRCRTILASLSENAFVREHELIAELERFGVTFLQASLSCVVVGLLFLVVLYTIHSFHSWQEPENEDS